MMVNCQTVIILAGGKSSRMGFDKINIPINGKRLIELQVEKLHPHFSDIILVSNSIEELDLPMVRIIKDEIHNKGPLAGLYVGLKASISEYAYLIACDMPVISDSYIESMKRELDGCSLAILSRNNRHMEPFQAIYHKNLLPQIKSLLEATEPKGIKDLVANIKGKILDCDDPKLFLNLNTLEEYKTFLREEESCNGESNL